MSGSGLGCVKTPASNLRVEIPSRFRQFENQKCLRPLLGEDDRENNSARSRLGLIFTQPGSRADLTGPQSDFRFTPESGLKSDIRPCPFRANSGSRVYGRIVAERVPKAARGGGHTASCDAGQGSSTILPPSPSAPSQAIQEKGVAGRS